MRAAMRCGKGTGGGEALQKKGNLTWGLGEVCEEIKETKYKALTLDNI